MTSGAFILVSSFYGNVDDEYWLGVVWRYNDSKLLSSPQAMRFRRISSILQCFNTLGCRFDTQAEH